MVGDSFMKALLIPVKDPTNAKTRLAEFLSAAERQRLVWAMFEDVSRAVSSARVPDQVFLVSSYQPAVERGLALGWEVLIEESQISESASVDWASGILSERGFDIVMRLPADLPIVRGEAIDELLSVELAQPGALIVPSREGTGTNALIRRPPHLFPSRFGPNSFDLHRQEAKRVGVECVTVRNDLVALDIDEPADLELLMEKGPGTSTYEALIEMGAFERLSNTR